MIYRIKAQYKHHEVLVTTVADEKVVNIAGKEVKKVYEATPKSLKREVIIPAATQEELKYAFDQGNELIEYVKEGSESKPTEKDIARQEDLDKVKEAK